MSWSLYRWVWQLEAPLFIGMPPAGSLSRCRLFVPARAIWGAITAELAQHQANGFPDYQPVGENVRKNARFTYLFPAEQVNGSWLAWLPHYAESNGLSWRREGKAGDADASIPDRQFRRRLLDARPGTAIDPESDSAAEGSLRETECIMPRWRQVGPDVSSAVALVGYVFTKQEFQEKLKPLSTLFLGGDTRYGLGRVRRLEWEEARDVFGSSVNLGVSDARPSIRSGHILGHAFISGTSIIGDSEMVGGWDRMNGVSGRDLFKLAQTPGSRIKKGEDTLWTIDENGFWEMQNFAEP